MNRLSVVSKMWGFFSVYVCVFLSLDIVWKQKMRLGETDTDKSHIFCTEAPSITDGKPPHRVKGVSRLFSRLMRSNLGFRVALALWFSTGAPGPHRLQLRAQGPSAPPSLTFQPGVAEEGQGAPSSPLARGWEGLRAVGAVSASCKFTVMAPKPTCQQHGPRRGRCANVSGETRGTPRCEPQPGAPRQERRWPHAGQALPGGLLGLSQAPSVSPRYLLPQTTQRGTLVGRPRVQRGARNGGWAKQTDEGSRPLGYLPT